MSLRPLQTTLLLARHVAPISNAVFEGGAVLIAGTQIADVGGSRELTGRHPGAQRVDLGDAILLPGLVNAHTHLELTNVSCGQSPASFTDWILSIPQRRLPETVGDATADATAAGIEQCLRFGVTTVGDISQRSHLSRPVLAASPLRAVSFGEVLGLGKVRPRTLRQIASAVDAWHATPRLKIGLTPHAPYTVDLRTYRDCLGIAQRLNLPLATHLAETPDETIFLQHQQGPFQSLWQQLGSWSDDVQTARMTPVRFAESIGLLAHPTLLAHVNYLDDEELALLANGCASAVYCPRTHAYFNHPPHRWREMRQAGINVAIGTDSCASSPDLNLLDDLRLVHQDHPQYSLADLWRMITIDGARALGLDSDIGSIEPGKSADLVAFKSGTSEPLRDLLESDARPVAVWIDGARQQHHR